MTPSNDTSSRQTLDARIAALAALQSNAISRSQALDLGASNAGIHRRLRSGRWVKAHPGVYLVAGSPPSWIQEVWCAYLAVGPNAVVTHESALHLHGIHQLPRRPVTFTVPHGGHARVEGALVHQIDDLRPVRVTTLAGLPVSRIERSIVELAATRGRQDLGAVVDRAVADRRTTMAAVGACFREVLRPGKPGMAKLAEVLDTRGPGYVPPQSELERKLFEAISRGGLPQPRRQFPLPGRGVVDGLVDAAYPDGRVIVEADGRRWHTRIRDIQRDHARDTEAARVGWLTLRFTYEDIVQHPDEVCAAVADVLAVRRPEPETVALGPRALLPQAS